MSVEFRQRTASDIARMLKRRKWLILLPIITMTFAVGYVVQQLPSIYQSKTLLTIRPPKISDIVVRPLTDEDLSQRLGTISKEVLSATSLEQMIKKHDLYEREKQEGVPMALILDKMRSNITVDIQKTDNERKIAAFSITYKDRTPEKARIVASELADKFINSQVSNATLTAEETRDFIENNLKSKKQILDELESEKLQIMRQNVETLPTSAQGLIAQLEGLRKREETISKEKEISTLEKARLNDNIQSLNSQARLNEDINEREVQAVKKNKQEFTQTPAYLQLISKRAEYEAKLENLRRTLRDANPKVQEAITELAKVDDEIEKLKKSYTSATVGELDVKEINAVARQKSLEIEKQNKVNQIEQIEQQMRNKDEDLRQNAAQIAMLEAKLNLIPNVQVALEGITTRHDSAKKAYDDALKMKNEASLDYDRASNAQGETINLQDPADLPTSPIAPKRGMLTALGTLLGLGIGLFLVAAFEIPRVLKIQNIEDAKHYTGLPVLASIPPLLTYQEKTWQARIYWLKVLAGLAVAIISIPLVIFVLQLSRIFDKFA